MEREKKLSDMNYVINKEPGWYAEDYEKNN